MFPNEPVTSQAGRAAPAGCAASPGAGAAEGLDGACAGLTAGAGRPARSMYIPIRTPTATRRRGTTMLRVTPLRRLFAGPRIGAALMGDSGMLGMTDAAC